MVTNIELNIKTLKGLSASSVDVVFNVKSTLFFGDKNGTTKLNICKMKRINDNQHALTSLEYCQKRVNVVVYFFKVFVVIFIALVCSLN